MSQISGPPRGYLGELWQSTGGVVSIAIAGPVDANLVSAVLFSMQQHQRRSIVMTGVPAARWVSMTSRSPRFRQVGGSQVALHPSTPFLKALALSSHLPTQSQAVGIPSDA